MNSFMGTAFAYVDLVPQWFYAPVLCSAVVFFRDFTL